MWLQGTVHINKWVSLLCICLYIRYDGFKKKGAMHFLWQSCQTPSSNKKQYITCLFTSHSQQHSKILSSWINHRICMWCADRQAWDVLASKLDKLRDMCPVKRMMVQDHRKSAETGRDKWQPVECFLQLFIMRVCICTLIYQVLELITTIYPI